jgi:hypothetical protein
VPILKSHDGSKASLEPGIDVDVDGVVAAVWTNSFDQVME